MSRAQRPERTRRGLHPAWAVAAVGLVALGAGGSTLMTASWPDVQVVARMQLAAWLLRHSAVLDVDRIEAIYDAARRSTTWRP